MSDAGFVLADERRRAGLSQRELARRARTTQSCVSRYESGEYPLTVAQLDYLLRVMGRRLEMRVQDVA